MFCFNSRCQVIDTGHLTQVIESIEFIHLHHHHHHLLAQYRPMQKWTVKYANVPDRKYNTDTFRLVDQNTATTGHKVCVNLNRLNWCDHCKKSMTVRYDVILWSGMRLRIKVGLNQSRTWSMTTVSVPNQYIKRKKWPQHGVKTGGHSLIRDPPLTKVGGPLTRGPPRIAATDSDVVLNFPVLSLNCIKFCWDD